jgi:hypothetical protein
MHKTVKIKGFIFVFLMMGGSASESGSGSVPLTNADPGGPKLTDRRDPDLEKLIEKGRNNQTSFFRGKFREE